MMHLGARICQSRCSTQMRAGKNSYAGSGNMPMISPSGRVAFTARIPEPIHRQLRLHCAQNDVDLQDVVAEALRSYFSGSAKHPASCPLAGAEEQETRLCRELLTAWRTADEQWREVIAWFVTSVRRRLGA